MTKFSNLPKSQYKLMEDSLLNSLNRAGFATWKDVNLEDIDNVFVYFIEEYKTGNLKVEELALACENFFELVKDSNTLVNNTKYGQHFFVIADRYYDGFQSKEHQETFENLLSYIFNANYSYWHNKKVKKI